MGKTPKVPFDGYTWRWASVQPTEGLNVPPVFFGVLGAASECEGKAKSSNELFEALKRVEGDVVTRVPTSRVTLARDVERNVLRNSGQYWQALGLLEPTAGVIELTELGREVASRRVSIHEFVVATIRTLKLPNQNLLTEEEVKNWKDAKIEIYPLRLILEIIIELYEIDPESGYLTLRELCDVVVPLAGEAASVEQHLKAIITYREGHLSLAHWPNCFPKANDRRSASEFLIFLANNGLLSVSDDRSREDRRYAISAGATETVEAVLSGTDEHDSVSAAVEHVKAEGVAPLIARARRTVELLARPNQQAFRRAVLKHHGAACMLTSEATPEVLTAAHIVHVRWGGPDEWTNGLPLRADVHTLWDLGLIQIHPDGNVNVDARLTGTVSYSALKKKIKLDASVAANLDWRLRYE
jgi:hypothetical protein